MLCFLKLLALFVRYLFSIESKADVEDYLLQLLDKDDEKVQQFVKQLHLNWHILKKKKQNEKQIDKVGCYANTTIQWDLLDERPKFMFLN